MNNNQYSVEILVGGRPVREFSKYLDGEYRTFIEGRPGTEYTIRITNNSNQKLLAICAVDSLSVVSGRVSDGYKGRGYIIQPYNNATIKGFRYSDSSVGAFKFTNKSNSYAAEKGIERNCGIIAVNLIAEKIPQPIKEIMREEPHYPDPKPWRPWEPYWYTGDTAPIRASSGACGLSDTTHTSFNAQSVKSVSANLSQRKASFDLGTGCGTRIEDKITHKSFEKGDIVSSFKIYYASRKSLENLGINFYPEKEINTWPNGFENDYCSLPKDWKP